MKKSLSLLMLVVFLLGAVATSPKAVYAAALPAYELSLIHI